ncbi:MAG: amidohydrolase family protein [Planctomycetales bacterium]|nr:amidohydrolase family protein [Planctomycetales bacterium]
MSDTLLFLCNQIHRCPASLWSFARRTTTLVVLVVANQLCPTAVASDQIPGAQQTAPIAIANATIHTISGGVLQNATIVFDRGKITYVGQSPTLVAETEVIQGSGKHVYPSLIEAHTNLGLVEINSIRASLDSRETGTYNPNVRSAAAFNPDSELVPVNRANGILLAVSAPTGGTISGRSSLMMLDGWTWEDMTLQSDVAMQMRWPESQQGQRELQELFDQTRQYMAGRKEGTVPRDLRLDSLSRVVAREMPIVVDVDSADGIASAVAFAKHESLKIVLHGAEHALQCAALLKAEGVPVIVSSVYRVPVSRHAAYDEGYSFPKRLADAGIKFCISAGGRFGASGMRNLPYHAATAAAYGLTPEQAIRSITLDAAEILGVADRVGALDEGLDATLFMCDGDILETPTQVEAAFIQGRAVDLDNKHKQLYRKYSIKYDRMGSE